MEGTHYAVVATGQMVLTPSLSPTFDDDDDSDHANKKTTIMMMMMLVVALMRCEQMVSYVKYPLFDDIATMILLCRKSLFFISHINHTTVFKSDTAHILVMHTTHDGSI